MTPSSQSVKTDDTFTADTRVDAGWIVTVDDANRVLARHSLIIGQGKIIDCLPTDSADVNYARLPVIDRSQCIIMPGMVNAHTHLAMNLMRGLADDLPLMTWLSEHIWPIEARFLAADYVRDGTDLALAECLLSGVTTVNDMYFFPDAVADACHGAGIRATIGMIIIDFPSAGAKTLEDYFDQGLAVHDRLRSHALLNTAFAPHAPYTVAREPLEKIATLSAELEIPVHIHVHETAQEVSEFTAQHDTRPIAHLHDIGLVNPSLLAVHLTQMNPSEIELLARQGVQALHCPESNLKLASGFCPVSSLLAAGVNVAIGTDGAASNNDLDMLGETRTAALIAKAISQDAASVPATTAIRLATINGARALGIDKITGSLEKGKAADFICIKPDITMAPMYDVASHIIYSTGRERITDVWVAGQRLVKNRELQTLDAERITAKAVEWSNRIRSE